jgi:hypothetical protein
VLRLLLRRVRQLPVPLIRRTLFVFAAVILPLLAIYLHPGAAGTHALLSAGGLFVSVGFAGDGFWSSYRKGRAKNAPFVPHLGERVSAALAASHPGKPPTAAGVAGLVRERPRDVRPVLDRMAADGSARRVPRRWRADRWARL